MNLRLSQSSLYLLRLDLCMFNLVGPPYNQGWFKHFRICIVLPQEIWTIPMTNRCITRNVNNSYSKFISYKKVKQSYVIFICQEKCLLFFWQIIFFTIRLTIIMMFIFAMRNTIDSCDKYICNNKCYKFVWIIYFLKENKQFSRDIYLPGEMSIILLTNIFIIWIKNNFHMVVICHNKYEQFFW